MRKVIVATLALFPIMLHAQANSPAQPLSVDKATPLNASLNEPKELSAAANAAHSATTSGTVRISTGVIAPKIIHTVDIASDVHMVGAGLPLYKTAIVGMIVDKDGKPSALKIVQSVGEPTDQSVLAAVSQFRFAPGSVSHIPVDVPVTLTIDIRNSVR